MPKAYQKLAKKLKS